MLSEAPRTPLLARSATLEARHYWPLLLPVLLVMVWLGAQGLDRNPIWNDEWYMLRDARSYNDPLMIAQHLAAQNPWHAPSYFILMNWWGRLTEWSHFTTRALSLLVGVLAVAWTYRLGRDWLSPRAGFFAAVLVATSEYFVHYTHEARMYTLTVLLTAVAVWLYLRLTRAEREPRPRDYALVFLLALFMLYTHYFLGLVLAGIGLYHLLFARKDRRWWIISGLTVLAGLLFLPYFAAFLRGFGQAANRSVEEYRSGLPVLAWVLELFSSGYPGLTAAALVLALVAFARARGRPRRALGLVLFILVVGAAIVLVTSLVLEIFGPSRARYLIFAWPLLALAASAGLIALGRLVSSRPSVAARVSGLALALFAVLGLWHSVQPNVTAALPGSTLRFPLHTVMRVLRPIHSPGDYIVNVVPDDEEVRRYNNIIEFYVMGERLAADSRPVGLDTPEGVETLAHSIAGDIGPGRRYVWLAYRTDPVPATVETMAQSVAPLYAFCGAAVTRPERALRIDEYARSPVCCRPETAPRSPLVDYGDGLALMGVEAERADGQLALWVAWQGGDRQPAGTYSVALHLVNADGEMVAQTDYGLPGNSFLCEPKTIDLPALPPGDYRLLAIVYDWRTGARRPGTVVATGATGDALPVATLTLE